MAKLFDIVGTDITLDPTIIAIPALKKIWDRDKDKKKDLARKELTYIVFLCDYSSPYKDLHEEIKELTIRNDIFKDVPGWEPDNLLQLAIDKYKELRKTKSIILLENVNHAIDELSKYFKKINLDETDDFGKPLYTAKDVSSNLKEIGNIVKSLGLLEKQVQTEIAESNVRGQSEIGLYEVTR